MIEFSQGDLFQGKNRIPAPSSVEDYLAMGYSHGTATQLAHLSRHLLRDIGVDRESC